MVVGVVLHEEGLGLQQGQGEVLPAGQGVVRRHHGAEVVLHELDPVVGVSGLAAAKGEVDGPLPEGGVDGLLASLPDVQGDAGVVPVKDLENVRQPEPGDTGEDRQVDRPCGQAPDVGGLLVDAAAEVVHLPDEGEDPQTVGGGPHPGAGADEQGEAQLGL